MSYSNFKKAMDLAKECKYFITTGGESADTIKRSEGILGITFSKQNRKFYSEFGYLSFDGVEIFGIDPDDLDMLEGNSLAYALNDRRELKLPLKWLPLYSFDDGYVAYLDYSNLNAEGEPPVIVAVFDGSEYINIEKVTDDFGDFLLDLVEEQLSNQ